jgi:hypothetical protein
VNHPQKITPKIHLNKINVSQKFQSPLRDFLNISVYFSRFIFFFHHRDGTQYVCVFYPPQKAYVHHHGIPSQIYKFFSKAFSVKNFSSPIINR